MIEYITDRQIYEKVICGLVPGAREFVWLATSDLKDMYVDKNGKKVPFLEIISDLSCQDSTDCEFVSFGVKPCGGPWRYLVYSATHVDNVLLNEKVKAYNEYNNTLNIRYGWISDCSLAIIPVLGCIEGECINNISNLKFHEHD